MNECSAKFRQLTHIVRRYTLFLINPFTMTWACSFAFDLVRGSIQVHSRSQSGLISFLHKAQPNKSLNQRM